MCSTRSHDTQTQCGCVLVKDNRIISSGYNGFLRSVDHSDLPTTRPGKYPFMIHSEANAIYNATINGQTTLGSVAYVTAVPCLDCLQALYQCGVSEVVFSHISNPKMNIFSEDYYKIVKLIKDELRLRYVPKKLISTASLDAKLEIIKKFEK